MRGCDRIWALKDSFHCRNHAEQAAHLCTIVARTHSRCDVMQGGFIAKRREWVNDKKPDLFAIEDPQEPGKDIAGGSFQVHAVRPSLALQVSKTLSNTAAQKGCPTKAKLFLMKHSS